MPVSISDVAEYAGVSTATVSRVLAEKPHVSAKTRERVLAAVQALDYQPDRAAQRLRSQSSDVLGLIVSDVQNPYFTSVARGVEDAAYDQKMNVLLCNTDESVDKERIYLNVMRAERVAGLIISPSHYYHNLDTLHEIRNSGIAVVLLDRQVKDFPADFVLGDNIYGTRQAVNHLISLGYQRIALIGGGTQITSADERNQVFLQTLQDNNLSVYEHYLKIGDFKPHNSYLHTQELIQQTTPPEAIFVTNNLMMLGVWKALREANIRIPEEIAVICFDDMPWATELNPPLTVIAQPTYEIGKEAFRLLHRRITEPDAPYITNRLKTQLIMRESCGVHLKTAY